jgi:cytochrome P450
MYVQWSTPQEVPMTQETNQQEISITPGEACPVAHITWSGPARPALAGHAMFDELRAAAPILKVPYGAKGFFLVTEHEAALQVTQDSKTFPQPSVSMETGDPTKFILIPQLLNGADHMAWRRLLAPYFSPGRVEGWEEGVRSRAVSLIEGLVEKGSCDFVKDFALRYPTAIFLQIFGLPLDQLDDFLTWESAILHPEGPDPIENRKNAVAAQTAVTQYFAQMINDRRAMDPKDRPAGIATDALNWQIADRPVSDDELTRFYLLMFMAGLDTVTSELSYGFLHLATHPEHRQQLADNLELAPKVTEELLRAYPIVNPGRQAAVDTEIAGCPIHVGDYVVVSLPSAGRDEAQHPNALEVDFNRPMSSHITFGAGPHRCLGSHLAREELNIAYEEWHRRIPNYWVDENPTEATAGMMALNSLQLRWKK